MMIHSDFPIQRKMFKICIGVLTGMAVLLGCGGGGGGGSVTPAGEQIPSALITSPTGTIFNEGENITFGGSANDNQDGPLDGSALTWISSIDGEIGSGSSLTTSVLSSGPHEITLKAIDSDGNEHITAPFEIVVEPTRFIKMGQQTTGETDAFKAFDGDHDTAATITTVDTEFIYLKAYIGEADTFLFKIKLGASTPGSRLVIQGLKPDATWQPVRDVPLDVEKTETVKVETSQEFKDADGYINLRARWEGGSSKDSAEIFEIWRIDPFHAGHQTTDVTSSEMAFDGDESTGAIISTPWDGSGSSPFLHFKAFVGLNTVESFTFKVKHNNIGPNQLLVIEVEDFTTPDLNDWADLDSLFLNSNDTKTITLSNVQKYLDEDGYISFRAYWVGFGANNNLEIYEIWRNDPIIIGPKTILGHVPNTGNAVDGNLDSFASIFYHWGEADRYDLLHVLSYMGDTSNFTFSIKTGSSPPSPGSELFIEGENEPNNWTIIERISLDTTRTTLVEILNSRPYINANGFLSLRIRWENGTPQFDYDINVYEIWK